MKTIGNTEVQTYKQTPLQLQSMNLFGLKSIVDVLAFPLVYALHGGIERRGGNIGSRIKESRGVGKPEPTCWISVLYFAVLSAIVKTSTAHGLSCDGFAAECVVKVLRCGCFWWSVSSESSIHHGCWLAWTFSQLLKLMPWRCILSPWNRISTTTTA